MSSRTLEAISLALGEYDRRLVSHTTSRSETRTPSSKQTRPRPSLKASPTTRSATATSTPAISRSSHRAAQRAQGGQGPSELITHRTAIMLS